MGADKESSDVTPEDRPSELMMGSLDDSSFDLSMLAGLEDAHDSGGDAEFAAPSPVSDSELKPTDEQTTKPVPITATAPEAAADPTETALSVDTIDPSLPVAEQQRQLRVSERLKAAVDKARKSLQSQQEVMGADPPRRVQRAIDALQKIPGTDTGDMLKVVGELGRLEDPTAVMTLREYSERYNRTIREACVEAMAQIGGPRAALGVLALLGDRSRDVRLAAGRALIRMGFVETIPALLCYSMMDTEQKLIIAEGIQALDEEPKKSAASVLRKLVKHGTEDEIASGLFLLSKISGKAAGRLAIEHTSHGSATVRAAALNILALSPGAAQADTVQAALQDADPEVRRAAIAATCGSGKASGIPLIVPLMRDSDPSVRRSAAHGLREVIGKLEKKSERVIAPVADAAVTALATEAASEARRAILDLMSVAASPSSLEVLHQLLKDESAEIRLQAMGCLKRLKAAESLPWILEAAVETDDRVRRTAVESLGQFRDKSVIAVLRNALKNDGHEQVRAAAARALGELKSKKSVPLLEEALTDDRVVKCQAVIALGAIGDPASVLPLTAQLRDMSPDVRYHSCNALASIGGPAVPAALAGMLTDSDEMVRRGAEKGLQKLGVSGLSLKWQRLRSKMKSRKRGTGGGIDFSKMAMPAAITVGVLLLGGGGWYLLPMLTGAGQPGSSLTKPVTQVFGVGISQDGTRIAAVRKFNVMDFWDADSGQLLQRAQSTLAAGAVGIPKDPKQVVLFGSGNASLWKAAEDADASGLEEISDISGKIMRVEYSYSPLTLYAFSVNGDVAVLDGQTSKVKRTFQVRLGAEDVPAVSADGTILAVGTKSGTLEIRSPEDGKELGSLPFKGVLPDGRSADIRAVAFRQSGDVLAMGTGSGLVIVWDLASNTAAAVLDVDERDGIVGLRFDPDDGALVGFSDGGKSFRTTADFSDLSINEELGLPSSLSVAFSEDASRAVLCAFEEDGIWIVDLKQQKLLHELLPEE